MRPGTLLVGGGRPRGWPASGAHPRKETGWSDAAKRDPYLFVGNQIRGPQSFCVLGAFWPTLDATRPRNEALTLL